jgi:carbon monoxide dehydrogenase subunit G
MDLQGEHDIPLAREAVWSALNDPEVLRACIPGCKELTRTSDTEFSARVVSRIGPVSASFAGSVVLSEIEPTRAYTITGSGQGGVAGFAKGRSRVTLADRADGGTLLTYTANAEVGGKLASLGGRMLEGAARKTANEFFSAFVTMLVADEPAAPAAGRPDEHAPAAASQPSIIRIPSVIRIEVGDIRIVAPWMTFVALAGWLAAAGLAWRSFGSRPGLALDERQGAERLADGLK